MEFCTGEHILGKLNKSLFINHPSVDPKQVFVFLPSFFFPLYSPPFFFLTPKKAILEVDEVKRVATLLSCSEVHTLVFRSMGGSAEKGYFFFFFFFFFFSFLFLFSFFLFPFSLFPFLFPLSPFLTFILFIFLYLFMIIMILFTF